MGYYDNPHKVGRPTRAQRAATVCITVRLFEEDLDQIAVHVEQTGFSRAELIREAMRRYGLFGDKWLKFRAQGLPGSSSENVTVRLTRPEFEACDRHVRRTTIKRGQLIRAAMERMGLFRRGKIDMDADIEPEEEQSGRLTDDREA